MRLSILTTDRRLPRDGSMKELGDDRRIVLIVGWFHVHTCEIYQLEQLKCVLFNFILNKAVKRCRKIENKRRKTMQTVYKDNLLKIKQPDH